jgi:hypothetical protein
VGELKSVGVPQESIGAIVEELNTKVFIPLREKMKNAPPEEPAEEDADENNDVSTALPQQPAPIPQVQYSAPAPTPSTYVPPISAPVLAYTAPQQPAPISMPLPVPEPVKPVFVEAPSYIPPTPPAPLTPAAPPAPMQAQSVSQFSVPISSPSTVDVSYPRPSSAPIHQMLPGQYIPVMLPVGEPDPIPQAVPIAVQTAPVPPVQTATPIQSAPVEQMPYSAPTPVATPFITNSPSMEVPAAVSIPTHVVAPHARTMQEDMQNLQSHPTAQAKHSLFGSHHDAPAPQYAPPQMPVVPQHAPAPVSVPVSPPNNREALHDILKGYGVDPYREPAE